MSQDSMQFSSLNPADLSPIGDSKEPAINRQPPLPQNRKRRVSFSRVVLGMLAGTLIHTFALLPAAAVEGQVVGVVRSPENAPAWAGITTRLRAAWISYRIIDLQQLQSVNDLAGITVVFLPNVETLTPQQMIVLQQWTQQGGRLIASGPVGSLSQPGVRQSLQSLLGAYWAFSAPQASQLQPLQTSPQSWARKVSTADTLRGGVIVPTATQSRTVATWKSADSPPAIVATEQTTFLGWQWGKDTGASVEFDSAWLNAALSRYGSTPPVPQPSTTAGGTAPTPVAQPSAPTRTSPPQAAAGRGRSTSRPGQPATEIDPAEAVAPAGIVVEPSSQSITALEAIAMRQELENLLGRFESALLSANSLVRSNAATSGKISASLTAENPSEPVLVASNQQSTTIGLSSFASGGASKAILQTRQVLRDFPQLIANRDYVTARQQWLASRQALLDNYPTEKLRAQPEVRAMWLDRGTIVRARSEKGLAQIFDRLSAAGINTIFFETVNAGYPIYPSEVAPQQNPLIYGWDPLASAVKLARERGMELHAWVWVFAAGNDRHNTLLNLPASYPGPVISAYPDWANYDHRGQIVPLGQGKPFLDPANPQVRNYLQRLFDEIVTKYDVDGLQLDYIRYPFQDPSAGRTYGYGKAARQQFQQLAGVDPAKISPKDRDLWQQWTEFRTRQVDTFISETSKLLKRRRPELVLSVAVFPLPEHERVHKLQQRWETWARNGDIDLIVPMTYAMDTNRLQQLAQPWLRGAELGSTLVLPGIRLLNLPEISAVDQIQALRDLPADGYALFAVENLSDRLHSIFNRTQGSIQRNSKEPVPYRQPFTTAAARFSALQREWDFLLTHSQLWIREPELSKWRSQVTALEAALNKLAEQPSSQNLIQAQTALAAFRSQFPQMMNLQALQNGYQVRTWTNRLATLDNLLRYGERAALQAKTSSGKQPNRLDSR